MPSRAFAAISGRRAGTTTCARVRERPGGLQADPGLAAGHGGRPPGEVDAFEYVGGGGTCVEARVDGVLLVGHAPKLEPGVHSKPNGSSYRPSSGLWEWLGDLGHGR